MRINRHAFQWIAKLLMLISIVAAFPMSAQAQLNAHCTMAAEAASVMTAMADQNSEAHCQNETTPMAASANCVDDTQCHCGQLFLKVSLAITANVAKPTTDFQASFRVQPRPPQTLFRPPQIAVLG